MKRLFCPITKVQDEDDGTIKVWGYASTGNEDDDGETIQPDAIKAALPGYLKWGCVREMHQPKAAGVAIEAEVQDDGRTWFGAHVIDPVSVKKVKAKALKGFSVGGRITARDELDKTVITGIDLIEVSLVDRPANPECEITICKRKRTPKDDVEDLAELMDAGKVEVGALLKAAMALASKPAAGAAPRSEPLAKGMYSVGQFASALESLAWIAMACENEREWEGDQSPVPAQLRAWIAEGAEIFKGMAAEEADELCSGLAMQAGEIIDAIEANAKGSDLMKLNIGALAKAGAKFSAETKAKMDDLAAHHDKMVKCAKELHGMCKEACDKMDALMPEDAEGKEAAAAAGDLGKGAAAPASSSSADAVATMERPVLIQVLEKSLTGFKAVDSMSDDMLKAMVRGLPSDDARQAGELADVIAKAIGAVVAPLQAEIAALKATPAGGVPFANAAAAEAFMKSRGISAVARESDLPGGAPDPLTEFTPVTLPGGKVDEGATMTKALLRPERALPPIR